MFLTVESSLWRVWITFMEVLEEINSLKKAKFWVFVIKNLGWDPDSLRITESRSWTPAVPVAGGTQRGRGEGWKTPVE